MPSLAKKLTTYSFHHHDINNLEARIQPFITAYQDPVEQNSLEVSTQAHNNLVQGAGAALADLAQLLAAKCVGIPVTIIWTSYFCSKASKYWHMHYRAVNMH